MYIRGIEAKLLLMNKGIEYIPGYNGKMLHDGGQGLTDRLSYGVRNSISGRIIKVNAGK